MTERTCNEVRCERPVFAVGLCSRCYARRYRAENRERILSNFRRWRARKRKKRLTNL